MGDIFDKVRNWEAGETYRVLRERNHLPWFRRLEGRPAPVVQMEGAEKIMLGSNNYLGLTGDERVTNAAIEATARYGTGLTGSRHLNGTLSLHLELEEQIADWMGTEAALVYTTGYAANLGCIAGLAGPSDTVVCDSRNHASIVDGITMSRARVRHFRHGRLDKLDRVLGRVAGEGGVLVAIDGIFSMEGNIAPVPEVVDICQRHDARLFVDEAHAVGVLGAEGTGASEELGVSDRVDLRMGTFSKSLASCGGFIAGPADVIEYLRALSRSFMFTAAGTPSAVAAAAAALRIVRSDEGRELRQRVRDNARYLERGLGELGFDVFERSLGPDGRSLGSPIVPVVIGEEWLCGWLWYELFQAGVYTNLAIYPGVAKGQALLRTSVMAAHTHEDLDRALAIFKEVKARMPTPEADVATENDYSAPNHWVAA